MQSKVGRGSTFWVELPLGIGSEAVTTQPPPAEPEMSRGSNHVEYVHGQALMRTGTNGTVDGASIPAAKDAAGKGRDTGPAAARTNSALHSLMDQGLWLFGYKNLTAIPKTLIYALLSFSDTVLFSLYSWPLRNCTEKT